MNLDFNRPYESLNKVPNKVTPSQLGHKPSRDFSKLFLVELALVKKQVKQGKQFLSYLDRARKSRPKMKKHKLK